MKDRFENAFGPMPDSFERSVQQALCRTKEVEPVKQFTIRTTAFAMAMLCCLIAVCLAATTTQPVDKISNSSPAASQGAIYTDRIKYGKAVAKERYHEIDADYTAWEVNYTLPIGEDLLFTLERVVHMADEFHIVGRFDPVDASEKRMIDAVAVPLNDAQVIQLMEQGFEVYTGLAKMLNDKLIDENGETVLDGRIVGEKALYSCWTNSDYLYTHSMISVPCSIDLDTLQNSVVEIWMVYAEYELTDGELTYQMESTRETVPLAPQIYQQPIKVMPTPVPNT